MLRPNAETGRPDVKLHGDLSALMNLALKAEGCGDMLLGCHPGMT
ncbi:hypothetical protein AB1M95_08495 [Sulfitobacter sp. LCG007]